MILSYQVKQIIKKNMTNYVNIRNKSLFLGVFSHGDAVLKMFKKQLVREYFGRFERIGYFGGIKRTTLNCLHSFIIFHLYFISRNYYHFLFIFQKKKKIARCCSKLK